jgi:hypothetical protein
MLQASAVFLGGALEQPFKANSKTEKFTITFCFILKIV